MNISEAKQLAIIDPYLPEIQAFIDEHITGTSTMTAIKIADGFILEKWGQLIGTAPITTTAFVSGFRLAVREGLITGIEGAQSKGYKCIGAVLSKQVIISPDDWNKICTRLHLDSSAGLKEVLDVLRAVDDMLDRCC